MKLHRRMPLVQMRVRVLEVPGELFGCCQAVWQAQKCHAINTSSCDIRAPFTKNHPAYHPNLTKLS